MDHDHWIRQELPHLSKDLGFKYTPLKEIENRLAKIRIAMERSGIEALLIIQKTNLYYLSGTTQDSFLFVPLEGKPLLIVKRELERAKIDSPIKDIVPLKSSKEIPFLIQSHFGKLPKNLGLELAVLSFKDYFKYQELFPGIQFTDISPLLSEVRKIKSSFEIDLMRTAGEIGQKVYLEAKKILREDMTEIEFGGLMEAAAKRFGHEGLLRTRSINDEAYSWHILSGISGGIVSRFESPMGGLGLSPAFPMGASRKKMKAHEPILVDFGICYHGYQVDETRMYSIGEMDRKFMDAYEACLKIQEAVLEETRPGVNCESIFLKTRGLAKKMGYQDSYLGPAGLQVRFVAHGIGLELSELPFMALGHNYPLEEGMTFAVEPKIVFPGEGAVGIENTMRVTQNGYEMLTPVDQKIFQI